jgi:hypothetical protein
MVFSISTFEAPKVPKMAIFSKSVFIKKNVYIYYIMDAINPPLNVIYNNMSITCTNIILNTQATFSVILYNTNNNLVINKIFIMSGDDYVQWTTDDYVYNWINKQIQDINN